MKKQQFIYLGIFIVALIVRLYMIQLDAFLHDWDERFHALVARNMMFNPFKPMLNREHLYNFDYTSWIWNEVWLHKQPLFLWQMALSMKLFGINEIAMRLPSALMGALGSCILYRIAQIVFKNDRIALMSSAFFCFSFYQLELTSGFKGMDHNDVCFGFYILSSIWAFYEFQNQKTYRWAIAIGLLAGCAILNKWLTGLLVFAPWGIFIIVELIDKRNGADIKYFLVALLSCIIVFAPWQVYILTVFPKEATYEFALNSKHITEVIEEHSGPWNFYLNASTEYFSKVLIPFILLGIGLSIRKINRYHTASFIMIGIVYIFFSLIVKTKIHGFAFIVAPLLMTYGAHGLYRTAQFVRIDKFYLLLLVPVIWFSLNPMDIKKNHFEYSDNHIRKQNNTLVYKKIKDQIPENAYFINIEALDNIELMLYNPNILSNNWGTDNTRMEELVKSGKNIVVFKNNIDSLARTNLKQYSNLIILNDTIELGQ